MTMRTHHLGPGQVCTSAEECETAHAPNLQARRLLTVLRYIAQWGDGAGMESVRASGIVEIGKRCLTNEKYDGYFESARAAIAKARGEAR